MPKPNVKDLTVILIFDMLRPMDYSRYKMLVIEDDETVRDVLRVFLQEKGFDVTLAQNGEAGLNLVRAERFDVILTDLIMPGISGMDVLKKIIASNINTPVLVMTAYGTVQTAVEAIKVGAFDYLTKPFNLDELIIVLEKALSVSKLQKENAMLKMQLKKQYEFRELIGDSASMQAVYRLIEKIADTDSTVLISGESGTGKELIAKTIHYNNAARAGGPFVPLNCAAIPKDLLESELFGHEKGAFTGAINTRIGRFELAQGGTLFLDEIGELDPSLQVKLLRVLQEREFERVGGVKTIKVDVRILAATNKDLEKVTKEGRFREDLYYRLNVIPLQLPSLRTRKEDIPLLAAHFIADYSRRRNREPFTLAPDVVQCLIRYHWPGNVRELENLMERLSILVQGTKVQLADLPEKVRESAIGSADCRPSVGRDQPYRPGPEGYGCPDIGDGGIDLNQMVGAMERSLITQALERTGGVRSRAAQLLGLSRTTFVEKMKKMGIEKQKR